MTVGRKKSFNSKRSQGRRKKKAREGRAVSHRRLDNKERDKKRAVPDAK